MSATIVASLLAVAAVGLFSYVRKGFAKNADIPTKPRAAYILENTVTHARLLPKPSTHAFTYPTLALLLSLDALETHALDLGRGWLFGYGGTAWRLTGLRSGAYLLSGDLSRDPPGPQDGARAHGRSIKAKLADVLLLQGANLRGAAEEVKARVERWEHSGDAWMLTMPSYLGYEGINPLTVYFCYSEGGVLEWIVLEIHNTFGEKHVHVLEPGTREDANSPPGYDHTWTFARDFHVSPFNDRSGFYTISTSAPPPPLSLLLTSSSPRPKIRIHFHAAAPSPDAPAPSLGALKLTAILFTRRAVPFTISNLLGALAQYPFALLLSFARILYHAWILHYVKRLDVFPRPDPKPAAWSQPDDGETGEGRVSGGVGWQPEGALEAYARALVEQFLARRAEELDVSIVLESGDPAVPPRPFRSARDDDAHTPADGQLIVRYTAPRFFSTILLAPSAEHMLLLGPAEGLFKVNSESLFARVFSASLSPARRSFTQRARSWLLPSCFLDASPAGIPYSHPLDNDRPVVNVLVICTMHLMDHLEKTIFTLFRARFVPGLEPWRRWERAAGAASVNGTRPKTS